MADSRDITGKNRKFTGTTGVVMPKGTTAERADTESGEIRFNTTTELMEYYDGTQWKPIDSPPTISSISTSDSTGDTTILNADGSTIYTITINGGNFSINPNVIFIGSTGTNYTAGNITRVSSSQITCTTLSNMGTSDDPYDVQVVNTSGLSATLNDAFSFNAAPVFATASGQLGTVFDGQVISGSTFNASATDAEGNTITYSIVSGSLPGSGLSLSSSTGLITGTLSGTPSLGNYPFVVQAATTEGTIERQFSIQVITNPYVAATGGTVTTDGDYKVHKFTGSGCFVVSNAGTPAGSDTVEYLVVAGGGGGGGGDGTHGGGGAGAGGYRTATGFPISATTYPITVGGGGGGAGTGSNSVFSTITSAGGGSGGNGYKGGGGSGGSGGGSGVDCGGRGTGNSPPVSPPQGNPGAFAGGSSFGGGGGGGGASAAGTQGSAGGGNAYGGPGGAGSTSSIDGTPTTRAGGGGGASRNCVPANASGGSGGGGPASPGSGNPGTANTGGGGGAGHSGGSSGGSGIVIIRYQFQ